MDDLAVVDLKDLRSLGIKYSRTHLARLMYEKETFPKWFPLQDDPKSRKVWWLREIRAYLTQRGGRR